MLGGNRRLVFLLNKTFFGTNLREKGKQYLYVFFAYQTLSTQKYKIWKSVS